MLYTGEVWLVVDLFFFYRPKIDSDNVKELEDVGRFYMVTCPKQNQKTTTKSHLYRLFLLGQKHLPEIVEGKSSSKERNWALYILTTSNPEDIHKELMPTGEGKYSIVEHDNHTELAYILGLPEIPGPTQKEFEIKKEASYIISVKNPDIPAVPGFAAFSAPEKKPDYPKHLKEMFGDRRWINVQDPNLLNYENTQLLLIGARKKGVDIDEKKGSQRSADLFKELKVKREQIPLRPIFEGKFPEKEETPVTVLRYLSKDEYSGGRGGKIGGKVAASKAASAASIAKVLSGIDFPKKKEVVAYARKNKEKVKTEDVLKTINEHTQWRK